ncbi:MAG: hypothetical protein V4463_25310, partial [Pseudomonadota bacterium]
SPICPVAGFDPDFFLANVQFETSRTGLNQRRNSFGLMPLKSVGFASKNTGNRFDSSYNRFTRFPCIHQKKRAFWQPAEGCSAIRKNQEVSNAEVRLTPYAISRPPLACAAARPALNPSFQHFRLPPPAPQCVPETGFVRPSLRR